jgi:hypothetical protein
MSFIEKIRNSLEDWAMSDFPLPIKVSVPTVFEQELFEAEHDVTSARWLMRNQKLRADQVGVVRKELTLRSLQQLDRVTTDLRKHDWYVLDEQSVSRYQKLATRTGFFGRLTYRFKQFFFAVERTLRHKTSWGMTSAWLGWFFLPSFLIGISVLLGGVPVAEVWSRIEGIDIFFFTIVPLFMQSGLILHFFTTDTKRMNEKQTSESVDKDMRRVGKFYATVNFVLLFLAPTVLLSIIWSVVSSPFTKGVQSMRRYAEIPLREFTGELPQNVQDVAFGLGKTIPELSFSLEVRHESLKGAAVMSDDPFFICRYGTEPSDKLYLWHELAA